MQRIGQRIIANGIGLDTTTPEYKFVTVDQTGIAAAAVTVAELVWNIIAPGTYEFDFVLQVANSSSAVASNGLTALYTGALSWMTGVNMISTGNTAVAAAIVAFNVNNLRGNTNISTTVDRQQAVYGGTLIATAPGSLGIRVDVSVNTCSVRAGSRSKLQRVR